jgi:hypothetical protein
MCKIGMFYTIAEKCMFEGRAAKNVQRVAKKAREKNNKNGMAEWFRLVQNVRLVETRP